MKFVTVTRTWNVFFCAACSREYINAFPLFAVAEGRFISAYDEEHARSVIVIGRARLQIRFFLFWILWENRYG